MSNLSTDVSIFTSGQPTFSREQTLKFDGRGIPVIDKAIVTIEHDRGQIKHILFSDGTRAKITALYAAIPFVQHTAIAENLGCEMTEQGYIKINSGRKQL